MSATNRGSNRETHDSYATPAWCCVRLLEELELPDGHWLEPCAGDGAIISIVSALRPGVIWDAEEIQPECEDKLSELPTIQNITIGDYLTSPITNHYDVIFTNPPYSLAMEFVEKGLKQATHVVMLLRINFLASKSRQPFMQKHPPDIYCLPDRPSFKGGKTDATEYAWFVWSSEEREFGKVKVLNLTSKAEKGK